MNYIVITAIMIFLFFLCNFCVDFGIAYLGLRNILRYSMDVFLSKRCRITSYYVLQQSCIFT